MGFTTPGLPAHVANAVQSAEIYFREKVRGRVIERIRTGQPRVSSATWRHLPRNLAIYKAVHFHHFTLQAIGLVVGLTRQRVKQIVEDVEELRAECAWTHQVLVEYGDILRKEAAQP
jgi:hypothetical protein